MEIDGTKCAVPSSQRTINEKIELLHRRGALSGTKFHIEQNLQNFKTQKRILEKYQPTLDNSIVNLLQPIPFSLVVLLMLKKFTKKIKNSNLSIKPFFSSSETNPINIPLPQKKEVGKNNVISSSLNTDSSSSYESQLNIPSGYFARIDLENDELSQAGVSQAEIEKIIFNSVNRRSLPVLSKVRAEKLSSILKNGQKKLKEKKKTKTRHLNFRFSEVTEIYFTYSQEDYDRAGPLKKDWEEADKEERADALEEFRSKSLRKTASPSNITLNGSSATKLSRTTSKKLQQKGDELDEKMNIEKYSVKIENVEAENVVEEEFVILLSKLSRSNSIANSSSKFKTEKKLKDEEEDAKRKVALDAFRSKNVYHITEEEAVIANNDLVRSNSKLIIQKNLDVLEADTPVNNSEENLIKDSEETYCLNDEPDFSNLISKLSRSNNNIQANASQPVVTSTTEVAIKNDDKSKENVEEIGKIEAFKFENAKNEVKKLPANEESSDIVADIEDSKMFAEMPPLDQTKTSSINEEPNAELPTLDQTKRYSISEEPKSFIDEHSITRTNSLVDNEKSSKRNAVLGEFNGYNAVLGENKDADASALSSSNNVLTNSKLSRTNSKVLQKKKKSNSVNIGEIKYSDENIEKAVNLYFKEEQEKLIKV
ncbi:hypothetical protein HDU92_006079 [Lobulomyces angularis]|nr:hypothetical protein HDU92_006079 [Lobulomyces angularis]